VVLGLLLGLQPLTTDLYLPALPALGQGLGAQPAQLQQTLSALILAFGLAQLVWGPLADRLGRKPVLAMGLALYLLAAAGAALAQHIGSVVAWRTVQGLGLASAIVCARAMVRDLFAPHQGALVMSHALTGLGAMAIVSPVAGGLLVQAWGWRATMATQAVAGAALLAWLLWRLPETATQRQQAVLRPAALARQAWAVLRHRGFQAWALLVGCTYGTLFVFLSSVGLSLVQVLGLPPGLAGLAMATNSLVYIAGTVLCRHWLPRYGMAGSVVRASVFSLGGAVLMLATALTGWHSVWAVLLPQWLFVLGHGVHQPCGQAGAVAAFPRAAGLAAALAGCVLALLAFAVGAWLGPAMDGTLRPPALAGALLAACTAAVALTLVRRHGEPSMPHHPTQETTS
jgi:DHA1 family bicyclomycin/chloramphenicol resistance-like MFS transporter